MRSSVLDSNRSPNADVRKPGYQPSYQIPKPQPNGQRPSAQPALQLSKRRYKVLAPAEGWLVLVLLAFALYSVVYSVVAAKWVSHGNLLYWSPALGLLIGLLISKTPRVPQPILHLGACLVGHWMAIWLTSVVAYHVHWVLLLAGLREAFTGGITTSSVSSAEMLFFFYLTFLTYFLGYFGSWLVYRAHLPWLVALVYSSILLVNLNYVKQDLLFLVIILIASLMLLVARVRLAGQVYQWRREGLHTDRVWLRTITWRCMQISSLLAILSLSLSGLLPVFNQAQAGKEFWDHVNNVWTNIVNGHVTLQNPAGMLQPYKEPANFFGDQMTVTGSVHLPIGQVLTYVSNDVMPHYLEGFTFDTFDGHTWTSSLTPANRQSYSANQPLPLDATTANYNTQVKVTVSIIQAPDGPKHYIFGPSQPASFDVATGVYSDGTTAVWTQNDPLVKGEQYNVVAQMPTNNPQVLTNVPLPTMRPQVWQSDPHYSTLSLYYEQLPHDLSPAVSDLTRTLTGTATDSYTAMKSIESYFGDQKKFTYSVNNPPIPDNKDVVDWLLQTHRGYCTYYASAMAVMGRLLKIPTRVVNGFSNGHYEPQTKRWVIEGSDAHSWVQAYFPSYGWINFDPTPGYSLDTKPITPHATPTPVPGSPNLKTTPHQQPIKNMTGPSNPSVPNSPVTKHPTITNDVGQALLIWLVVIALLVSVLVLLVAVVSHWWRNLYANSTFVAGLFWRLCWIASRAGLAPQPWQTPYEYSSVLSEHITQNATPLQHLTDLFVRDRWGAPYAAPAPQEEARVGQLWPTLRNTAFKLLIRRAKKQTVS